MVTLPGYLLNSPEPTERTRKKWISQGLMAKWGVVIANLILGGESKGIVIFCKIFTIEGPHAFIVNMRTPGIKVEDMPRKTTFNSLDTCYVSFDDALLPPDSMLSGLCRVTEDGVYELTDPKVR